MTLNELKERAEKGDPKAQYDLGECYWNGTNGVSQDYQMAVKYYEKSADQGYTDAIYSLGYCYATETGTERDIDKAKMLLEHAIDNGSVIAAAKLGQWYYWGDYFPKDRTKGFELLKYAAENGDAHSMAVVGDIYCSGIGAYEGWGPETDKELGRQYIEKACDKKDAYALFQAGFNYCNGLDGFPEDNQKGVGYLKEAAELGHAYAQLDYAIKCWNGDGVPQNQKEYAKWMREAAGNGNEEAIVRWAWTRIIGAVDGVRCQSDEELNECLDIVESALEDGDDFMVANKEAMEQIHAEEARLGRRLTISDFYDPHEGQDTYGNGERKSGGCYVATAVYGSYDCPEVWTLRRYRDYALSKTIPGRLFIKTYYAISPTLVKWFGNKNWFKNVCKGRLDRMVAFLQKQGYSDTPYKDN